MVDNLVPVCGPRCDQCPAYKATQSGNRAELEHIAAEWTKGLGKTFTAEDILCDGCRVEGGRLSAYCATCEIRLCAQGKGHPTCAHCDDYPCARIVAPPAREALDKIRASLHPAG